MLSTAYARHPIAILVLVVAAAALVGCESVVPYPTAPPAAAASATPPMTHSRAASECWMSTEKGRADMNLDKRADFVTKCIDEKMKGAKAAM